MVCVCNSSTGEGRPGPGRLLASQPNLFGKLQLPVVDGRGMVAEFVLSLPPMGMHSYMYIHPHTRDLRGT